MTGSTRPAAARRARPDLEVAGVTGWTFVFDRPPRRLHRLNPTAASVFALLDGTVDLDELTRVLADRYATDPAEIAPDVQAIVEEFEGEGLLVGSRSLPSDVEPGHAVRGFRPPTAHLAPVLARCLADRAGTTDLGIHQAMGFRFRVLADEVAAREGLRAILEPLAAESPAGHAPGPFGAPPVRTYHLRAPRPGATGWRLHLDASPVLVAHSVTLLIDHLLWHLNRMAVLSCGHDTVFHAAAAADERGAVLLPGESNAGKSTLVTGLVADGLGYLSDEAILLDEHDRAWPYPKAIDLDPGSWPVFPGLTPSEAEGDLHQNRWHIPPDRIRPGSVGAPTAVRAIVSPRYEEGAAPRLEAFAPEEAFALLLEQAFHVGTRPGAIAQVARLVETVPCHRVVSGRLDGAVALVRELLAAA
jgi:hypothetical protein